MAVAAARALLPDSDVDDDDDDDDDSGYGGSDHFKQRLRQLPITNALDCPLGATDTLTTNTASTATATTTTVNQTITFCPSLCFMSRISLGRLVI